MAGWRSVLICDEPLDSVSADAHGGADISGKGYVERPSSLGICALQLLDELVSVAVENVRSAAVGPSVSCVRSGTLCSLSCRFRFRLDQDTLPQLRSADGRWAESRHRETHLLVDVVLRQGTGSWVPMTPKTTIPGAGGSNFSVCVLS